MEQTHRNVLAVDGLLLWASNLRVVEEMHFNSKCNEFMETEFWILLTLLLRKTVEESEFLTWWTWLFFIQLDLRKYNKILYTKCVFYYSSNDELYP